MSYLSYLLNPYNAGVLYSTTKDITDKDFVENVKKSPLLTSFDIATNGLIYGYVAHLAGKIQPDSKVKYLISGILLASTTCRVFNAVRQFYQSKKQDKLTLEQEVKQEVKQEVNQEVEQVKVIKQDEELEKELEPPVQSVDQFVDQSVDQSIESFESDEPEKKVYKRKTKNTKKSKA